MTLRNTMNVLGLYTAKRRELGVVEAAELLDRSKSTVSRWLSAMEETGFLDRDGTTGLYRVGIRLAALGELARQSTSLQQLARPYLHRLAEATGETSNLVVLSGGDGVNMELVESPRPIKHVGWLGRRLPLHATAAGKVLLAWLPEAEVRRLVPAPLERFTRLTIATPETLLENLREVRRQGYAEAWGELEEDLAGFAAPVRDHQDRVVGTLTIGAPVSRVPRHVVPHLVRDLKEAAAEVSAALGHREPAAART